MITAYIDKIIDSEGKTSEFYIEIISKSLLVT